MITLNQGRSRADVCFNTVPTSLARRGKPATSATLPYVQTLPLGIRLTAAMIRAASLSGATVAPRLAARFLLVDGELPADWEYLVDRALLVD